MSALPPLWLLRLRLAELRFSLAELRLRRCIACGRIALRGFAVPNGMPPGPWVRSWVCANRAGCHARLARHGQGRWCRLRPPA